MQAEVKTHQPRIIALSSSGDGEDTKTRTLYCVDSNKVLPHEHIRCSQAEYFLPSIKREEAFTTARFVCRRIIHV